MQFVNLNRHFIPLGKDAEPSLDFARVLGRQFGGLLNWSDLLDHQRVVLLAEASSGKTEEFKHTAVQLRARGSAAFYTTIEQLAEGRVAVGPTEEVLFTEWKTGSEPAWFFLDSIDEARLNHKKFDGALRMLAGELGTTLARANILISCRVSDWRVRSDPATILEMLPIPKPAPGPAPPGDPDAALLDPIFERNVKPKPDQEKGAEKPELLIARLAELSDEQRKALARASGVNNVDEFNEAITRKGLDALADRPGDVLELATYWAEHHDFGTLAAMSEQTVKLRLSESDPYRPDNTVLPPNRAREGAERLAAALTLGKSFTLLARGHEPDPSLAAGALDPVALLDGWTVAECNALLRRGIFAPSTYGRVRFHHRSTQEYLTAQWLERLLDQGVRSEIFKLLFVEQYGVETVVPSLRAAAAWLALRHPDIRSEVIKREPVSLIQQGDPAGLPSEAKAALLLRFATRHAKGDISDANMDRRAISLFASADLADIIRKVWTTNPRPDFRADLVRLIREGRIFICADLANVMARDKTLRDYHRILAVQALVACGATQELSQLTELLMREAHLASPRLAAEFAQALFPKHLTLPQLLVLIERSKQPRNFSAEGFAHVIDDLWSACPLTQRSDFIAGVGELCAEEPFVHDYQRVAGRHQELAKRLGVSPASPSLRWAMPILRSLCLGFSAWSSVPNGLTLRTTTTTRHSANSFKASRSCTVPSFGTMSRRYGAIKSTLTLRSVTGRCISAARLCGLPSKQTCHGCSMILDSAIERMIVVWR